PVREVRCFLAARREDDHGGGALPVGRRRWQRRLSVRRRRSSGRGAGDGRTRRARTRQTALRPSRARRSYATRGNTDVRYRYGRAALRDRQLEEERRREAPTRVLGDGAWGGACCWEPVVGPLRERDVNVDVIERLPTAGSEPG